MSVKGSHYIAILKVSKANYNEFLSGLKDIINEIRDLQCVTVTDTLFKIKYYLGRDINFQLQFVGLRELHVNAHAFGASVYKLFQLDGIVTYYLLFRLVEIRWPISAVLSDEHVTK